MLERFERNLTVEKLLRQVQEKSQSAEPMEIAQNDDVVCILIFFQ